MILWGQGLASCSTARVRSCMRRQAPAHRRLSHSSLGAELDGWALRGRRHSSEHQLCLLGIHLGDVVEESDGDLMGDGVNIAARLEGIAKPGAICLSEDAYRQVKSRLDLAVNDLGATI